MKELIIADNMIAIARGRKGKAHTTKMKSAGQKRSAMLRMIMPFLSRETGEKLAMAIDQRNSGKFSALWDQVKKEITNKLNEGKHKATAASLKVDIPDDMLLTVLEMVCKRMCEGKDPCPLPPCEEVGGPKLVEQHRFVNFKDLYERLIASEQH